MQHLGRTLRGVRPGHIHGSKEINMLTETDREALLKATQTAELLKQDALSLRRTENPLLSEIGFGLLEEVAMIHNRLDRLVAVTNEQPED